MELLKKQFQMAFCKNEAFQMAFCRTETFGEQSFYVDKIFWKYYREIHYVSWNILPEVQDLHKNWISNL